MGTFDFSEKWFRNSGLYSLNEDYQMKCINAFINSGCSWSNSKLQRETEKYEKWQEYIDIAKEDLVDQSNLEKITKLIENDTFKTKQQLDSKIDDFNAKSKNKLIQGDALQELKKLEDVSIDLVITDPPYGQNYVSNRSQFEDHITKKGVQNDDESAFELVDKSCKILEEKTKPNAHIYIFCSWKVEPKFREIINKYFTIKNIIIWDKMNHGAGDLEGNWGGRYEMIIFATKGNRPINIRKQNIVSVSKIASSKLIHPTQKPVKVIKELLEVSSQPNDTICDPFMGSGSTIKACKQFDDLNYIGIEISKEIFEKAKAFIGE